MKEYLTKEEHALLSKLGNVFDDFNAIVQNSLFTSSADLTEIAIHIHALQNMLLAQAAGRAYPAKYRLLGGTINA